MDVRNCLSSENNVLFRIVLLGKGFLLHEIVVICWKLLKEINKQAVKHNRTIECLLQFHIAEESTKFGLNINEAEDILVSNELNNLENIRIVGVMGMATYTNDLHLIRSEFKHLHENFVSLKKDFFHNKAYFKEVSMGMSGDYKIAIEEGSTMIRIGTKIFGERNY